MVTILKYKKITIDHAIYIKVFYNVTVSYLTVSTNDVLNTTNNETSFFNPRIFFENYFGIKVEEVSILKYLNLRICQSPLGFSIYQTDHIMELVNEWFQNGKLKIFDTHFRIYYTYEKEIMAALILTVNSICKVEMEYHGKIGHTLGHIEHIGVMIIIGIFYKD